MLAKRSFAFVNYSNHLLAMFLFFRYQLYVVVLRAIAYPFNAKQPTDMARRQLKMSVSQLDHNRKRFLMFLKNEMPQIQSDEAFFNAVNHYNDTFLKSSRIEKVRKSLSNKNRKDYSVYSSKSYYTHQLRHAKNYVHFVLRRSYL